jgi:hypothetical protein
MPAKPESEARKLRLKRLLDRIRLEAVKQMPGCSRCVKEGADCLVAPNINPSCARCLVLHKESSCDVFMSFKECEFLFLSLVSFWT